METYLPKLNIKSWADDDKPREKLLNKGRHVLSDAELIAILLGSGSTEQTAVELAKSVLASKQNNLFDLGKLTVNDLCSFKGIGEAKAITLIAAFELGRRRSESKPSEKTLVRTSRDAFRELAPVLSDLSHEEFWILLLNRGCNIEDRILISRGGLTGTIVDVRIVFKHVIQRSCTSIILAHNHPSGQKEPSHQDIELTKKITAAARLMDIQVMDHLIIAGSEYYSFADEGKL